MSKWSNPDCKMREERRLLTTTHRISVADTTAAIAKEMAGKPPKATNGVRYIFNGWSNFCELSFTKSPVNVSALKDFLGRKFFLSPALANRLMFYKINSYPTLTLIESEVSAGDNVLISLRESPQNVDLLLTYLMPPRDIITKWTPEELDWRPQKDRNPWDVDTNLVKPLSTLGMSYLGDILTESLTDNPPSQPQQSPSQQPRRRDSSQLNSTDSSSLSPLYSRVVGVLYTLSMITRLPENINTTFAEAHTKHLVEIFTSIASDSTLVVLVAHCLHIFANSAPHQFYWRSPEAGLRARTATQPEAGRKPHLDACTSATNTAADAGVLDAINKVLRTTYGHNTGKVRCLAADTLGALVTSSEQARERFWGTPGLITNIQSILGSWSSQIKSGSAPQLPPATKSTSLQVNTQQIPNQQSSQVQIGEEVTLRITLFRALTGAGSSNSENKDSLEKFGLLESAVDTILWGFKTIVKPAVHSPGGPRRAAPLPPQPSYTEHAEELATESNYEALAKAPKEYPLLASLIGHISAILGAVESGRYSVFDLFTRVFDPAFRATSENVKARARFSESTVLQQYLLEQIVCQQHGSCAPEKVPSAEAAVRMLFSSMFVGKCDTKLRKMVVRALCTLARRAPAPQMYTFIFDRIEGYMKEAQGEACVFCVECAVVLLTGYVADMSASGAAQGLLEVLPHSRKIVSERCPKEERKDSRYKHALNAFAAQVARVLETPCALAAMREGEKPYGMVFELLRDPELFNAGHEAVGKIFGAQKTQVQELRELCDTYVELLNTKGTAPARREVVASTLKGIREICTAGQEHAALVGETQVFRYMLEQGEVAYRGKPSGKDLFAVISDLLKTFFCLLGSVGRVEDICGFEENLGYKRLSSMIRKFFIYERTAGSTGYEAEVMGYLFNFMCNDTSPASSQLPQLNKLPSPSSQLPHLNKLSAAASTLSLSSKMASPSSPPLHLLHPAHSTLSSFAPAPPSALSTSSLTGFPRALGVPDIENPSALIIITDLLPDLCSSEAVGFVLYKLSYLIQNPRNRAVCCHRSIDLIRRLLVVLCRWRQTKKYNGTDEDEDDYESKLKWNPTYGDMKFDQVITSKIIGMIKTLGCYSITPKDLHFMMRILAYTDPKTKYRLQIFPHIVDALRAIAAGSTASSQQGALPPPSSALSAPQSPQSAPTAQSIAEPRSYYDFTQGKMNVAAATAGGETGSGIILPSIEKAPFQKGFTFTTWISVDKCGVGEYKPRIFRLSGENEMGIELYLSDSFLTFKMASTNADESFSFSKFVVSERRWMFLALTISTSLLKSSEIRLYVGDTLVERMHISYPRLPPCTMNSIGCSLSQKDGTIVPTQCFSGQIASANFFDDSLSHVQIQQIYGVGPNYLGLFTEADFPNNTGVYFGNNLVMGFNCFSLKGDYPLNIRMPPPTDDQAGGGSNTNTDNEGDSASTDKPEISTENLSISGRLKNVVPCYTSNIKEIIECVEGIGALFPLLLTFTRPPQKVEKSDEESLLRSEQDLLINVVDLINSIVIGSKELEDDMLQKQGYAMLAHILKKVPPKLLTPRFVRSLSERHGQLARNKPLQDALFWDLAMDFTLWAHTPSETQREVIATFAASPRVSMRHLLATTQMVYWNEAQREKNAALLCREGPRPSDKELSALRGEIFGTLRRRMESGVPFSAADGDAFVGFLLATEDNFVLSECLNIFIRLFKTDAPPTAATIAVIETLLDRGILGCLLDILRRADPDVCLIGVHLIFTLMFTLKTRYRFSYDGVLAALTQGLLANPANIELTPSLYSVMQGAISEQYPGVLCACILPLISRATSSVRILFLNDLASFVKRSECAAALLDYPGWYASLCNALKAPAFTSGASKKPTTRKDVVELAGAIGKDLVMCAVFTPRFSWTTVEPLFVALRKAAGESELVQECEIRVFEDVVDTIISLVGDQECTTISSPVLGSASPSPPGSPGSMAPAPAAQSQTLLSLRAQAKAIIKKQGITPFVTPLLYIVDFFFVHTLSPIKFYGSMSTDVLLQAYISLDPAGVKSIKTERRIMPRVLEGIECLCGHKLPTNWGSAKTSVLVKSRSGGFASLSAMLALRVVQLITVDAKAVAEERDTLKNFRTSVACIKQVAEDQAPLLSSLSAAGTKSTDIFFFILNSLLSSYKVSVRTYPGEVCDTLCAAIFDLFTRLAPKQKDVKKALAKANDAEREIYKVVSLEDRTPNNLSAAVGSSEWVAVKIKFTKKVLPYFLMFDEDSTKTRGAFDAVMQTVSAQMSGPIPQAILALGSTTPKSDQVITIGIPSEAEVSAMTAAEKERLSDYRQDTLDANLAGSGAWLRNLRTVMSGKGIWGTEETYDKWKLDKTETGSRMRLKLKRNHNFDIHEGMAPVYGKPMKSGGGTQQSPSASDSGAVQSPEMPKISLPQGSWMQGEGATDDDLDLLDQQLQQQQQEQAGPSNPEKVIFEIGCELVKPGKIIKGTLTLHMQKIVFKETREDTTLNGDDNANTQTNYVDKVWDIVDIKEVQMRRFLLVRTALEVFFVDKTNCFLNFETARLMNNVYGKIVNTLKPPNLDFANTHSPAEILRKSGLTRRWVNREISNFDYLMALNTIAGRTYNDLRQYPVFPWIIADYTSEKLDLESPETYRDLSKPVGALNPKRLQGFRDRFENFLDDTPPFMYATHYSSADNVFFYLIRTEPFTSYFLDLQKKFDLADRMFYSIADTWHSCNSSPYDVKELIPEFFYFPEFLRNSNGFDLGTKQNGDVLGDVKLPPWAHGSPEEFVRINREALESEHVSAHLHEWIDLIFGYKQRGQAAVEANNVFCYFTYEGGVNLDKITDDNEKEAMKSQIANFGQTPSQLLTKPHPARGKPRLDMVSFCQSSAEPRTWTFEAGSSPIVHTKLCPERLITIDRAQTVRSYRFALSGQNFSLDSVGMSKLSLGMRFAPHVQPQKSNLFATTREGKYLFVSGFWDKSIKTYSLETGHAIQTLTYHKDVVTCISYTKHTIVTGSKDTTVIIWDTIIQASNSSANSNTNQASSAAQGSQSSSTNSGDTTLNRGSVNLGNSSLQPSSLTTTSNNNTNGSSINGSGDDTSGTIGTSGQNSGDGMPGQVPVHSQAIQAASSGTSSNVVNAAVGVAKLRVSERPRHILYGHVEEVCALDANADLDIVVSGAIDGSIAVHTLREGNFCWSTELKYDPSTTSGPASPLAPGKPGKRTRAPTLIRIAPGSGKILVYSAGLRLLSLFSINGSLLQNRRVEHELCDISVCSDEKYFVTSCKNGSTVSVYYLHSLELVSNYELGADSSRIRSMSLMPESERILATGMKNGSVVMMTRDEALKQKKGRMKGITDALKFVLPSASTLSSYASSSSSSSNSLSTSSSSSLSASSTASLATSSSSPVSIQSQQQLAAAAAAAAATVTQSQTTPTSVQSTTNKETLPKPDKKQTWVKSYHK